VTKTPATKGHDETIKVSTDPPSKVEHAIHSTQNQNNNGCSPRSSTVENDLVQARNAALTPDLQNPIAPKLPAEASSSSAISEPVVLKTTTEDKSGPHKRLGLGDLPESKASPVSVLEIEDMPLFTDSSEEETPKEPLAGHTSPKTSVHIYLPLGCPFDTLRALTVKYLVL
jgi:hypothetical protein